MHDTMSYIFSNLERAKLNFRLQKKINKYSAVAMGCLLVLFLTQQKEIKTLKLKVKELAEPVNTVEE